MPKIAKQLTALEVSRLKAPGLVSVGAVPGLAMQITPGGARSWVLRAKVGSKRRDIGLGAYPAVTLAQAHEKARQARAMIEQGQDPVLERKRARSALLAAQASTMTFEVAAGKLIESKKAGWRNEKHGKQWSTTLAAYAFPVIGALDVRDIQLPHIVSILEPIWATKTETASRVRSRLEAVLNWAKTNGYREGENPARWRGHLDNILAKPSKVSKVKSHPAVPIDQCPAFYASLQQAKGMAALALRFAMLTAARSGEVRAATWSEFDLEAGMWVIPAAKMKAERDHRVPLPKAALDLLKEAPQIAGSDLVFTAPRGGQMSDMTLTAVMRRMGLKYVPHGLRSSFKDWASERTSFPNDMTELALAHVIPSEAERAYRRGDQVEKRRELMNTWAKFLETPVQVGGTVVQLKRKAA